MVSKTYFSKKIESGIKIINGIKVSCKTQSSLIYKKLLFSICNSESKPKNKQQLAVSFKHTKEKSN